MPTEQFIGKKDSLAHKKLGSVTPSESKIIWVKMLERIGGEYDKLLSVCYRFNAALEDQLADHKRHYILDIGKNVADPNYLSAHNQLNYDSMHRYWRELDRLIDLFEQDYDNFKPSRQVHFEMSRQDVQRYKTSSCFK